MPVSPPESNGQAHPSVRPANLTLGLHSTLNSKPKLTIPLLVTVDVEIALDHDLDEQAQILDRLGGDLDNIPVTWFCTADAAEQFRAPLQRLQRQGHEIGCHGLDHSPQDDYRTMTFSQAKTAIGVRPQCFRGPRMTTSASTQAALVECGYRADFSVCARRSDFWVCGGASWGWLLAPRGAYHPAAENPFRRGDLPLWAVNLSSFGLPLLSGMLYLCGLSAMQAFFHLFLAESRRTGAPIVYLFHSYEFTALTHPGGQPWHHRLYESDRARRYENNLAFLRYMQHFADVRLTTASPYLEN